MITLRQMSVAFLIHGNKLLLMEKPKNASFVSGMVVPIGGHLEQHEINNPSEACLREVEEETGLTTDDLTGLELRYIILRIKETEIRIQYVYFSNAKHIDVRESEEGKLLWVDIGLVDKLNVTATTKYIIEHYSKNKNSSDIFVGTMKSVESEPEITWALLEDWEKLKVALS
ncbi:NUDIX domain-containing protein [Bacillus sp. FJAT-28004]|uniref:NUDIX domain-containing protein n=1 Tax=Bacillus sp. FJAT-28004 TaxID=1679165 RepID=UPI0006B6647D|nr:NUDIX domain-containing protein [Bacillus sp. FJAT-28004]